MNSTSMLTNIAIYDTAMSRRIYNVTLDTPLDLLPELSVKVKSSTAESTVGDILNSIAPVYSHLTWEISNSQAQEFATVDLPGLGMAIYLCRYC